MTSMTLTDVQATAKGLRVGPVTLKLDAGVHALLGEPGEGGRLLLDVLAGAVKHRGSIQGLAPDRVAAVLADLPLPEELSCAEYIEMANEFRRLSRSPETLLSRFGLADWTRQRIDKLPRPERKALAIAEALTSACAVVLLDAPRSSISTAASDAIESALTEKVPGRLCVFSTNQIDTWTRAADSVSIFEGGRLLVHAKPHDGLLDDARYRVDCSDPGKLLSLLRRAALDSLRLEATGDTLWVESAFGSGSASVDVAKLITRAAAEGSINVRRLGREPALLEVVRARLGQQLQALRGRPGTPA